MSMNEFAESVMLVNFQERAWGGRKQDKAVQRYVEQNFNMESDRGRYTKHLCKCIELDKIKSHQAKMRSIHYHWTSPWSDNGPRALAAINYMDYTNALREPMDEHEPLVKDFVRIYPDLIELDKRALGNTFKWSDYPSPAVIESKFSVRVTFSPIPTEDDFRLKIAGENLAEIKQTLRDNLETTHSAMMYDLLKRLLEPIKNMAKSLAEPDKVFRDSLVYNVLDVAEFLPRLNYQKDPEITVAINEAVEKLCSVAPDTLRESKEVRQEVAKEAAEIVDDIEAKMSGYM